MGRTAARALAPGSALGSGHDREECIATDGKEWHYVQVLGPELGPYPDIAVEDVERALERFAASLPEQDRIHQLRDADPLHIDGEGVVRD